MRAILSLGVVLSMSILTSGPPAYGRGGCSGGGCSGGGGAEMGLALPALNMVAVAPPSWLWTKTDDPTWQALWFGGAQVGAYRLKDDTYRPLSSQGEWGEVCDIPSAAPPVPGRRLIGQVRTDPKKEPPKCSCCDMCACGGKCKCSACKCKTTKPKVVEEEIPNFGVDEPYINKDGLRYYYNGKEITRDEAKRLLEKSELIDDSQKMRMTVIGTESQTAKVKADMDSPAVAALRAWVLPMYYAPDHWAVSRSGFKCDGAPTIYLQSADGRVLHRQDDYQGPEELMAAVRKIDPLYDPRKDPDLRKTPVGGVSLPPAPLLALGGLAAAGGLAYLRSKRRNA
jgi:hypothetical protein